MLFPTTAFFVFFVGVFGASWGLRSRPAARKWLLVLVSYVFYAGWDWRFCALLLASSLLNYGAGLRVAHSEGRRRRTWVAGAVALNLAVLGFFKYYNFFSSEMNAALRPFFANQTLPLLDIVLPVAISFFTFHGISYVVDVHRGKVPACRSPLDLLLYISFFPQLVAGPIVRASMFLPQLQRPATPETVPVGRAALLIGLGLFKKVVVANAMSTQLVDPVFMTPSAYGTIDVMAAIWGYAVQIYCDFSAYTDIATGVALLLGYDFPQNFNQPYRARSIQDFWHRWHISLSTWLREYLYIPLGGNRHGRLATYRNMLITMILGGLWHGAGVTFLIWGCCHGVALTVERAARDVFPALPRLPAPLAVLLVFHFVCLTWVFFRAPELTIALDLLAALAKTTAPPEVLTPFLASLILGSLAFQFVPATAFQRLATAGEKLPAPVLGGLAGLVIIAIDAFGPDGVAPFIYFQF